MMMEEKKDEEMMALMEKPSEKEKKPKPLRPINYEYLNGLRGWGAFAVFLFHYQEAFWKMEAPP